MDLPVVNVYPTRLILTGEQTEEEYIRWTASEIYDAWVCGARWIPEDLCKMIMWEANRRGYD